MKKVEFQGMMFEVPDWAKWIAQDSDGSVYVYQKEPNPTATGWGTSGGKVESVVLTSAPCVIKEIK